MTVRVVLADDQPLVRSGLRVLIADTPDLEVVGEAANGEEAVRLAREVSPDVVVMDIRMPGMDGIEATQPGHRGPGGDPRAGADHLRRGRLRLRRAARRRERLPGQGHGARRHPRRDPGRRRRGRADRAGRSRAASSPTSCGRPEPSPRPRAACGRGHHRAGARGADAGRARPVQQRDRRTSCTSPWPRPSRTWPACSPNWAPGTGSNSSSSPTSRGWSPRPAERQSLRRLPGSPSSGGTL